MTSEPPTRRQGEPWRVVGFAAFAIAGVLLLSMGGAIVAAPVTVPVMFIAASRHPTVGFRITAAVLGSLTVAETVWALTYLGVEEAKPWIWLLPVVAGSAFSVAIASRHPESR